ncbi:MAG: LTA synthase family protein [Deltaproteobacteria bacterium]|jgi:phosphoglycerol transferase MdoB-like AlkP superfamily enzyme|nr:LTA synthase family protein [Deltaproteobacteria bacterium]
MMAVFSKIAGEYRFRYVAYLAVLFLLINITVRLALQTGFSDTLPFTYGMFPALLKGTLNDCAALVFVLLLPATLVLLPSDKFLQRSLAGSIYTALIIFLFSALFIFAAFAEYFFWDEFGSRFNFIAVDYLIYTTELMRNMVESYPLFRLLSAVFLCAAGVTALLWKNLHAFLPGVKKHPADYFPRNGSFGGRLGFLGGLYATAALLFFTFTPFAVEQNRFWNEYAKNGVYELFSAYRNNQLDYRAFYKTIEAQEAFVLAQREIRDANPIFGPAKGENLLRMAVAQGPEKQPNVIIVLMESMGSNWLGEYTPNLNALAGSGLSFSNMMSTGTRTVRGIEALMLSVPPTPGNSIVRRPDNERLFNLGTMFRERSYDRDFIYGGIGYFDNMNAFFTGNGYTVTDKLDFAEQSKTFSNAWGQCDEDLYSESLRLADRSFQAGTPFHQVLLTTSNHRPFTFPEGTVDRKQGSRRSAVNYADYAIGRFMREARGRPWFDNTVFVFVGDHPSSIAGKTEVPADAYGIVCVMYGPKYFRPETVNTLCSQIDVAPTLLASLGWEYRSQFFGTNARKLPAEAGRAWISTYQLLGFRTNERLVVLEPDGSANVTRIAPHAPDGPHDAASSRNDAELVARTVASYQCAYDLFTNKRMKESVVIAYTPRLSGR